MFFKKLVFAVMLIAFFATTVLTVSASEVTGPISHLTTGKMMQAVFDNAGKPCRVQVKLYDSPIYPSVSQVKSEDGLNPDKLLYGEIRYERMVNGQWRYDYSFQMQHFLEFPSLTWETKRDQLEGRPTKIGLYITYLIMDGKKYPRIHIVFKDNDLRGSALYTLCPVLFQEVHSGAIYPD